METVDPILSPTTPTHPTESTTPTNHHPRGATKTNVASHTVVQHTSHDREEKAMACKRMPSYSQWNLRRRPTRAIRSRRKGRPTSPVALFTGIVQGKARIQELEVRGSDFRSLRVQLPTGMAHGIVTGASVALNGTCLTVTRIDQDNLHFDVIEETLRATNLGDLRPGDHVNYERSARMGDEIGGHQVSGHVHCTGTIREVRNTDDNCRMVFQLPTHVMKYILPKGFVAVDGCSLTVGEVDGNSFSVYLIPETLRLTVLGEKTQGDRVNIEVDAQTQAIVDTVERVLAQQKA